MSEPNYDELDEGIRGAVRTINAMGFVTTDSGDGTSELECAVGFPHVFARGNLNSIHTDLEMLQEAFPDARVEASYALGKPVVLSVMWPPASQLVQPEPDRPGRYPTEEDVELATHDLSTEALDYLEVVFMHSLDIDEMRPECQELRLPRR